MSGYEESLKEPIKVRPSPITNKLYAIVTYVPYVHTYITLHTVRGTIIILDKT